jgi:sugar phosphate isomerase/epimerase
LKDRVRVIHVKDGFVDGRGMPLGMGEAPLKKVIDYASANGMTMVVESETLTPSGLDEAEICINYLKSLE